MSMLINRPRATTILEGAGIRGVIGTTPENVGYITGFWAPTTWRHRTRKAWAILPQDPSKNPCLVLSVTIADVVVQQGLTGVDLFFYGEFFFEGDADRDEAKRLLACLDGSQHFATPEAALEAALRSLGIDAGTIGVDEWGMPSATRERIAARIPALEQRDAYDLLRKIRMIKTGAEIALIRQVVEITEVAFNEAVASIRVGQTERDIARVFQHALIQQDALPTLSVIGAGRHGGLPTAIPSDNVVEQGDIIRFDIGCFYQRYHSDFARTVAVGEPSAEAAAMYEAMRIGLDAALQQVKPGNTAAQVFRAAIGGVEASGVRPYRRHHCGHGQGVEGYEPPMIAADDDTVLEAGMVLCVETPYYRLNVGGVQIEDIVVVTEHGYDALTTLPRGLIQAGTSMASS